MCVVKHRSGVVHGYVTITSHTYIPILIMFKDKLTCTLNWHWISAQKMRRTVRWPMKRVSLIWNCISDYRATGLEGLTISLSYMSASEPLLLFKWAHIHFAFDTPLWVEWN